MSLALLCPGQGAQHPAMFDRARDNAAAREVLDGLSEVLGQDVFAAAGAEARKSRAAGMVHAAASAGRRGASAI